MKRGIILLFLTFFYQINTHAPSKDTLFMKSYAVLKTASHIPGLNIALLEATPTRMSTDYPVLFIHGSSFPSALAFGFRMNHYSWMDHLAENGYPVFALDFPGYGHADRYPEMLTNTVTDAPPGRATSVYLDVDKAVDFILERTGKDKVYLIGHSWGGSVAALYASRYPDKIAKLVLFAAITARQDTSLPEKITQPYEALTPAQRIADMRSLTPATAPCRLAPEIFDTWGDIWLQSDPLAAKYQSDSVRFPAGPSADREALLHNIAYYHPEEIRVPTLIIRGEWDTYPDNQDAEKLFVSLKNAPQKKYVVIEKGTHVMHLEESRLQLYTEVTHFLQQGQQTGKHAVAVIFEVIPADGHKQEYLDIAAALRPQLEKIDGFISIERFQSIYHPEKILSLSFWADEKAIEAWRNMEIHRAAQWKGRQYVFKDYRLRVAQVVRDYGMFDRQEVPVDSRSFHGKK
ncbi:alpha/beta fold hydrolase [Chitinophaga varians]|uniref:alpha/beta fold hydrolase n=1 Tax=Chitinophaga varians TaxID=2202339 RepID=UPI00166000BD|nr:alpha/beta fold hydrolase [Chitinophaga varians]MBC9915031.1 alpha/beta fold hydrolase [Chitinophaga varians]